MEVTTQLDLMQKIQRELDDVKNSQTSVLKKIAQIEVHNLELNDKELEEKLADVHQLISDGLDKVNSLSEDFDIRTNQFRQTNNL